MNEPESSLGYTEASLVLLLYRFNNGTHWAHTDLSRFAGAPASAGDPFVYTSSNQVVVYRGTDGDIHLLFPR
jgi:hypothetical protein